jgi:prepilin-type N-terminal cleavage/methylation domain-containing protein
MRRTRSGFTLPEIMIVVVMIGVTLTFALPKISSIRRQLQLDGAAAQLAQDFNRARTEAIMSNAPVTLKRSGTTGYRVGSLKVQPLPGGITFVVSSPDSARFEPLGPVLVGAGTYQLQSHSGNKAVVLLASGMAVVQ